MSDSETVYSVKVRYGLGGNAGAGLDSLSQKAQAAERHTLGLKSALLAVGGGLVMREGFKALIGFDDQLERSRISIAAVTKLNLGGTWADSMKEATGLVSHYQEVAKSSAGTTQDFLTMHQAIAPAILKAGVAMDELKEITAGAVVAAPIFGEHADLVAMDIKQMLAGTVGADDRFAQQLLSMKNMTSEAYNAKSVKERAGILRSALTDPTIKQAAKAYEGSFAGVTSTLKDNLQMALGRVGLPLFQAITVEVKKWNAWIDKHPKQIAAFAKTFSSALVTGLKAVQSVASFVVENKDVLLTLAKVWAASQVVGGAVGGAQGLVEDVTGARGSRRTRNALATGTRALQGGAMGYMVGAHAMDGMNGAAANVSKTAHVVAGAMAALPGPMGAVGKGLSGLILGIDALAEYLGRETDKKQKAITDAKAGGLYSAGVATDVFEFDDAAKREWALRYFARTAADMGALQVTKTAQGGVEWGQLDIAKVRADLAADPSLSGPQRDAISQAFSVAALEARAGNGRIFDGLAETILGIEEKRKAGDSATSTKSARPGDVNVTIQRVEVTSEDPDRFVHGMLRAVETVRKNPTQAVAAFGNV